MTRTRGRGFWGSLTASAVAFGAALASTSAAVGDLAAQSGTLGFEVQAGVVYSTAFASGEAAVPGATPDDEGSLRGVDVGPALAPAVGVAVSLGLRQGLAAELRLGASAGGVRGRGDDGSWDAGDLTAVHGLIGVRADVRPDLALRLGAGKIYFSSSSVTVLEGDASTGILVSAALGYAPPVALPIRVWVEAQRHDFGSPALRTAGAGDGAVLRFVAGMSYELGGGR